MKFIFVNYLDCVNTFFLANDVLPLVLQAFPEFKNQAFVTRNLHLKNLSLNLKAMLHFKLKKKKRQRDIKMGHVDAYNMKFDCAYFRYTLGFTSSCFLNQE